MGNEDNEVYHDYSVDAEDQPSGFGDSLSDDRGLTDPMDEGYSPPERWSVGQGYGNTPAEEMAGETLAMRLKQEEPEPDPYNEEQNFELDEDGLPALAGGQRAGRIVDPEQRSTDGNNADTDTIRDSDLYGRDVGIDGAGASAEEAAMHILEPGDDWTQD